MSAPDLTASWVNTLADSGVKADLLSAITGDVLTEAGALRILQDVEAAGAAMTASEFSSLQVIAANLNNGLVASAYVASIFTQLVDGNPANAFWNGGSTTALTLGNLKIGSSSAQLGELIGKWFLGTDLPDPTLPPGAYGWSMKGYRAISAPLYGSTGAPSVADVCQGADGDCEFLAGVIETIVNHPALMDSMIVNNGDGTWGVRFFVGGNEIWETVNDELPSGTQGLTYAQNPNETNDALWVGLVEKDYAQLSETGLTGNAAVNSYNNINGDYADDVLQELTNASAVIYYNSTDANWNAYKSIFIDALANGSDVIFENDGSQQIYDGSGNLEVPDDHAMAVIGYDASTGDFIIRNPWGQAYAGQNWDAQFEISMAQVASIQGDFAVDDSGTNGSTLRIVAASDIVAPNAQLAIGSLFEVTNSTGASVKEYNLQLLGAGALALDGATNLATAAQTALGQIVVSASQLAAVSLTSGVSGSTSDLLVSVSDGATWSATADVQLTAGEPNFSLTPVLDASVAQGATVALTNLFAIGGSASIANASFELILPASGGGALNLNGATNYDNTGPGHYSIDGDQLSLVTYTAPSSSGSVTLQTSVYIDSAWTPWLDDNFNVGVEGAVAALQADSNGQLAAAADVADTAADIFANLDDLQTLFSAGVLQTIAVTDTTSAHEILDAAQFAADEGLLSILSGNYTLGVTDSATDVSGEFDALNRDTHIDAITLTDAAPVLTLTIAQALDDTAALHAITNASYHIDIVDTASDLEALLNTQITALASEGVTELTSKDASVSYNGQQTAAILAAGLTVAAPANDKVVEAQAAPLDNYSYFYGPTGALTKFATYHADKTSEIVFYTPGTFEGVAYVNSDETLDANGNRVSVKYDSVNPSDPSGALIVRVSQTVEPNGVTSVDFYNDAGVLLKQQNNLNGVVLDTRRYAPGSAFGISYASYDVAFNASGAPTARTYYDAGGDVLVAQTFTSNGYTSPPPTGPWLTRKRSTRTATMKPATTATPRPGRSSSPTSSTTTRRGSRSPIPSTRKPATVSST